MALKIEKMISGCRGLAHDGEKTVIVDGVLPGETVEYKITNERKGTVEAEAARILDPSPLRIEPQCPYYGVCGGCNFLFVGTKDSAAIKEDIVKDTLRRLGGLEELPPFLPPAFSSFQGYRIRCRVHVDLKTKRQGFLAKGSNRLVEISRCPALEDRLNALISEKGGAIFQRARSLMFENRTNRSTGFVEVPLFSGDDSVSLSDRSVEKTISGIRYSVSSSVFFQSNPRLLSDMLSFVEENTEGDDIMDLYSGVGTFSALFEGKGKTVYAVEREKKCLELSRRNAPSAISFTDDCARWAKKSGRHVDTVIVDPPRVGLDGEVVEMIQEWKPERVIYISCNPVTCARDLALFSSYRADLMRVFDAYPGSEHIEMGVVLSRK
ncbi:MAG: class I SAM-dependent RNA methyltransferase [Candidatus Ornithospirochaeta sp.]